MNGNDEIKHERELREQWQKAHEKVHALGSQDLERRLDIANKFREQITEERGQFVLRVAYDEQHNALRDAMDLRLKMLEQSKSNLEGRLWAIGAGISVAAIGLDLLLHYLGK